jgi:hypothetical protein
MTPRRRTTKVLGIAVTAIVHGLMFGTLTVAIAWVVFLVVFPRSPVIVAEGVLPLSAVLGFLGGVVLSVRRQRRPRSDGADI